MWLIFGICIIFLLTYATPYVVIPTGKSPVCVPKPTVRKIPQLLSVGAPSFPATRRLANLGSSVSGAPYNPFLSRSQPTTSPLPPPPSLKFVVRALSLIHSLRSGGGLSILHPSIRFGSSRFALLTVPCRVPHHTTPSRLPLRCACASTLTTRTPFAPP